MRFIPRTKHVREDGGEAIVEFCLWVVAASFLIHNLDNVSSVDVEFCRRRADDWTMLAMVLVDHSWQVSFQFMIEPPEIGHRAKQRTWIRAEGVKVTLVNQVGHHSH